MDIEELYRKYRGHIFLLCRRYIRDSAGIEDVVQTVFMKAWRSLDKFNHSSSHFTWLYRIAVNECLNYLRKNSHESIEFDEKKWFASNDDSFHSAIEKKYLWTRVIKSMDYKERIIILLYAVEGLNMSEIAEVMDISRQALHKKWNSIMIKLKRHLKRY